MVIDAQASWPSFEDFSDTLKSAAVAEAKPTKVVIAGSRAKNLFASDFADLPGILERDRGYAVAAAFVWHKLRGMVSEHWLHRGDDARKMVNRTGWDALIRDEGTSLTSPIHSTAICCRPMSRHRWERLSDDAQQGWHRLEVW